jgi:hypothetical protein
MLDLNGEAFASGRSKFLDHHPKFLEPTAKIFVNVGFPGLDGRFLAQVDTGAAYSTLEVQVAEALGLFGFRGQRPTARISTRIGAIDGQLVRIPLTLIADEGVSLDFDATFFVSRERQATTFLGYVGLLDRIRIALDSPANHFYFGVGG